MMEDEDNKVVEEAKAADIEVQEEPKEEKPGVTVAGVHLSDVQLPMVGMFFAGIVLLIAVGVGGRGLKWWAYSISVASVAMFFSLFGLLLTFKPELNNENAGKFNAYFLFLWCFVGACFLTFAGAFQMTGNGYFASWALALFSIMGIGVSGQTMKNSAAGIGSLIGLIASSIIVIIAVATKVSGPYRNESIYILVLAIVTVLVVAFLVHSEKDGASPSKLKFPLLAFFAINWIVAACLVTFQGPFLVTGNGYFGSWGGAITSVFATMAALKSD